MWLSKYEGGRGQRKVNTDQSHKVSFKLEKLALETFLHSDELIKIYISKYAC